MLVALNREGPEKLLGELGVRGVRVKVIQQRYRERRCQAGGEHVNGEVGVRLWLIELAVSREHYVFCPVFVLLPEDVVSVYKPFEEPFGVRTVKDVDSPLTEAVEDLADTHRNIRGDVLVEVPAFVVHGRCWNAVPVVVVEHAVFRDGCAGRGAGLLDGLWRRVAQRIRCRRVTTVPLEVRRDRHRNVNTNLTLLVVLRVDPAVGRRRVARLREPRRVGADVQTAADDHLPGLQGVWREVVGVSLRRRRTRLQRT